MATVELLTTPQPHLMPGYAGFCPQYQYRCGETYAAVTHKLLLDPTISHAEDLVLSSRAADSYEVRPARDVRTRRMDPTYRYPMVPGYQGFMPNLNARLGQRYTVAAAEGLADFERQQLKNRAALNQLRTVVGLQGGAEPRNLCERQMRRTEFKMPLETVRPDFARTMRSWPVEEACEQPKDHHCSPYFMDNGSDQKHFVSGYAGHIPFGYAHFGSSNLPMTNSALCDFTSNYRMRQSTEWAPTSISRPDPPLVIRSAEIYHKHVGMIPNYHGHIPGAAFRYGKTFGADSRDAKRWLRGDFTY